MQCKQLILGRLISAIKFSRDIQLHGMPHVPKLYISPVNYPAVHPHSDVQDSIFASVEIPSQQEAKCQKDEWAKRWMGYPLELGH